MADIEPMRVSAQDLYTPRVESFIEEQSSLSRGVPETPPQPLIIRILYSSCFYLSLAGMFGALAAWAVLEPFIDDTELENNDGFDLPSFLLFPTVAAGIGLLLGMVEGLVCRNPARAATSALVGLGIGFIAGCVALFAAGIVFMTLLSLAVSVGPPASDTGLPRGFGFLLLMMGRGAAWAIAAIAAGIGQGIALRDKKIVLNGVIGAVLGGLAGGMLFDPIYVMLSSPESAAASRAVGFAMIGILVGLFIGLVENWTKTAWLLMKAGPLAGKQFILFRNPTVVGSSPKCDIYLFKDAAIEPRHALIHDRGGRFEIEDAGSADGTYVNGRPIKKHVLGAGDQIVIGKTVLEFSLRDKN